MKSTYLSAFLLLGSLVAALPAAPEAKSILAFRVGRLHPVSSPPIEQATIVVRDGKIVAVGTQAATPIPEGAIVRDLPDAVVIPGLVDTHSHLGVYSRPNVPAHSDGNEMSGPVQAGVRALDAIWPDDPGIRMANAGGVTTANIMPGSGNVIGGATLYVKLRGATVDEMQLQPQQVLGGLKMANGENPKGYGRRGTAPFTRMKVAALQREQFLKAREYVRTWKTYCEAVAAGKKPTVPEIDPNLEALAEVLERKRTVHFHCHRADDIMTAVRLAEEFGFELVLQHCTEGYRVAEELAKRKIPVSLTLVDAPGGKAETMGLIEENAAILHKAGVLVAINTDDSVTESRFYLRTGSIAVRGGLSEDAALQALTWNGAKMLHLDHRLGTLEVGKDADFVILSGPPFSIYTQVLETWIDGKRVFDRSRAADWLWQVGGFALRDTSKLPQVLPPQKPLAKVTAPKLPQVHADATKIELPRRAIRAGRIHPGNGPAILDGVILIEGDRIAAVGPAKDIVLPPNIPTLTVAEVTPGLIDAYSVCGLSGAWNIPADQDQDELSDPNQADLRVIDAFHPQEPLLEFLRANGVTLIHAMPGRANPIAGQTGLFRTWGRTVEASLVRFPAGMLINLGEVPKEAYKGKRPATRMGTALLLREAMIAAKNYQHKLQSSEGKKPEFHSKSEAWQPILAGKLPLVVSAHRADDLLTGLRIAQEFGVQPILCLATESYLIAERLSAARVPVILHPPMQRAAGSMETLHSFLSAAKVLADHGVLTAISTAFEGYVPKTRMLRAEMAMAMTQGLGTERALRAVTIDAAKLLGVDDRFGSIEKGKIADLVLYDGDPFENTTHVEYTLIGGRVVFDRSEYTSIPFARRALSIAEGAGSGCCMMGW